MSRSRGGRRSKLRDPKIRAAVLAKLRETRSMERAASAVGSSRRAIRRMMEMDLSFGEEVEAIMGYDREREELDKHEAARARAIIETTNIAKLQDRVSPTVDVVPRDSPEVLEAQWGGRQDELAEILGCTGDEVTDAVRTLVGEIEVLRGAPVSGDRLVPGLPAVTRANAKAYYWRTMHDPAAKTAVKTTAMRCMHDVLFGSGSRSSSAAPSAAPGRPGLKEPGISREAWDQVRANVIGEPVEAPDDEAYDAAE